LEVNYFDHQHGCFASGRCPPPAAGARVAMAGDIMGLHRAGSVFLDPSLLTHLNNFDIVLGNLETLVSHRFPIPSFLPDALTHNSNPASVTSFRRPDGRTVHCIVHRNNHSSITAAGISDTLDFSMAKAFSWRRPPKSR
jgi:hypothetical protein